MPPKKITWVLVGDGASAQIYKFHAIPLRLTQVPGGRFRAGKPRAMTKEPRASSGAAPDTTGHTRHAIERQRDSHQRSEDKFVARVAGAINKAADGHKFDDLILVAPPRALAAFRTALDATTKTKIKRQVRSEWTNLGIKEIESHLAAHLAK